MKRIILASMLAINIRSYNDDFLPNMVPNIIVNLASMHLKQKMTAVEKLKCLIIKDYLDITTRHFLMANENFKKALQDFSVEATDDNCQKILNQLAVILHIKTGSFVKKYSIDYNYVKSLLFKSQNNEEEIAYLDHIIAEQYIKTKNLIPSYNFPVPNFSDKRQAEILKIKLNKSILINQNNSELVAKKIKDALAPSSKDDLKNLENLWKFVLKKATNWFYNYKNLVK